MAEKILVVGNGSREHALAYRLSLNESFKKDNDRIVFVTPGNAGIAHEFECIKPQRSGPMGIVEVAQRLSVDLVVVGSERYLADGLINLLSLHGIASFGPNKKASILESSKHFMKKLCSQCGINTADYSFFNEYYPAISHIKNSKKNKFVIKANGLCGGKGVTIHHNKTKTLDFLHYLYNENGFNELSYNSQGIIIEDYLEGPEVSVFGVISGEKIMLFPPFRDYKRLLSYDKGPNTGGMGAFGPVTSDIENTKEFLAKVKSEIFEKTVFYMQKKGMPFHGLLYAGLMLTKDGIKLLEYNVRFGDPETQALLFGCNTDIYPLLKAVAWDMPIDEKMWQRRLLNVDPSLSVVLASKSYPKKKSEAFELSVPKSIPANVKIFYGATDFDKSSKLIAKNGRVLNIAARDSSIESARAIVYDIAKQVNFDGKQYRTDIGKKI